MISSISSLFLLTAAIILLSTTNAADLPGNYTLPKGSDTLCFAARFNLTLNVEYVKFDGKKNISKIPLNNQTFSYYDGTCSTSTTHKLQIFMLDNLTSISFDFFLNEKNETSLKKVYATVTINSYSNYFPNYTASAAGPHVFLANESLFVADRGNSYRCNAETSISNFKTDSRNVTIKAIDITDLRIQPFVNEQTTFKDYAPEKVCKTDYFKASNLVPIIVGACLGLLVVGVLVAYLIGRRRNRNGYQSV